MEDFDEVYDFVVAGSGGGSMCAGLYLHSVGKSVLILEKTELLGGSTSRSGGVMWIPNNRFMKRDGIDDSYEQATTYLDNVIGDHDDTPGASQARRQTYLTEAPYMVDFLLSQGIELTRVSYWPDYYDDQPGGSEAGRTVVAKLFNVNELGTWKKKLRPGFLQQPVMLEEGMFLQPFKLNGKTLKIMLTVAGRYLLGTLTNKRYVSAGMALQGRMLGAALKNGVQIRTDSPVQELIVENGAVTGVVVVKHGRGSRVGARSGVLVNAGGFAHNQRMRDQYQPGTSSAWSSAAPGDTGEMIEEMMRCGAAIAQMEQMVGHQATLPPGREDAEIKPSAQAMTAAPHAILVDQSGQRYMNEAGSYMAYCQGILERHKTVPAIPSWAIFDSQYIGKYALAETSPRTRKPQRWYQEGYLHKADTIAALASQIDVDPSTLEQTVGRFNGFVASNRDEDFHRGERAYDRWLGDPYHQPSANLGTIERGPYYAVPVVPGDVGTYGGVVTDEYARVLREDGSVIAGLYATGVSTASVMGRAYPGAGASVGPSFVWGYVAAKHAAGA